MARPALSVVTPGVMKRPILAPQAARGVLAFALAGGVDATEVDALHQGGAHPFHERGAVRLAPVEAGAEHLDRQVKRAGRL